MTSLEGLREMRAAMLDGIITPADYERVKASYIRASELRAALDANILSQQDWAALKETYLSSLLQSPLQPGAAPSSQPQHAIPVTKVLKQTMQASARIPSPQPTPPSAPEPSANANSALQDVENATLKGAEAQDMQASGSAPASLEESTQPPTSTLPPTAPLASATRGASAPVASAPPPRTATPPPRTASPPLVPENGEGLRRTMSRPKPTSTGQKSVSGVGVQAECERVYQELKRRNAHRYITFRVEEDLGEVVLDCTGDPSSPYEAFLGCLPESDCRFAVYDFKYVNEDRCQMNKILFVLWSPDNASIKSKMLYASTKEFFKGTLDGLAVELQASDLNDLDQEYLRQRVRDNTTRK
eukprot:jgi/Chlat1/2617/Chrsp178S02459